MLSHRICHDNVLLLKLKNLVTSIGSKRNISRFTSHETTSLKPLEKQNRKPPEAPKVDSKVRMFNWMKGFRGFRAPTAYSSSKESMVSQQVKTMWNGGYLMILVKRKKFPLQAKGSCSNFYGEGCVKMTKGWWLESLKIHAISARSWNGNETVDSWLKSTCYCLILFLTHFSGGLWKMEENKHWFQRLIWRLITRSIHPFIHSTPSMFILRSESSQWDTYTTNKAFSTTEVGGVFLG